MKNFFILIYFTSLLNVVLTYNQETHVPEVKLSLGSVRGSYLTTRLGKIISTFRGIRYAKAPIDDLRFQPAVPIEPWDSPLDASKDGPACPQPDLPPYLKHQSEDCLHLNIYTKNVESKKPVIVYFHPGGFFVWSDQTSLEGPDYLLDQDIVLVTVNYRLGALGFLSTGDAMAPGNLGLKDQVVGLRWIQKHIEYFGGDPNSVTITGGSIGSASVSLHIFSPMSKNLFHRAILASGTATGKTPLAPAKKFAIEQAVVFGCPSNTTFEILNCLKNKTATEIVNSTPGFYGFDHAPISVYFAVVEPDIPGIERFLPAQPNDLAREGKFNNVPVIAGITKDEFAGVVNNILANQSLVDDLNNNWLERAPQYFLYEENTPRSFRISRELRRFFLQDEPITHTHWQGLADLYSDSLISFGVHRFVNLLAAHPQAQVWYYKFSYQGQYISVRSPAGQPLIEHGDDLRYLFYQPQIAPTYFISEDHPDSKIVTLMTTIWGNFAKTGRPIPDGVHNVTWTRFTPRNKDYLDIGDELVMRTGLNQKRNDEWEKLFPLPKLN